MVESKYRFGGFIPNSVLRLQNRRRNRQAQHSENSQRYMNAANISRIEVSWAPLGVTANSRRDGYLEKPLSTSGPADQGDAPVADIEDSPHDGDFSRLRRELLFHQARALQMRALVVGNPLLRARLDAESSLAFLRAMQGEFPLSTAGQEVAHG